MIEPQIVPEAAEANVEPVWWHALGQRFDLDRRRAGRQGERAPRWRRRQRLTGSFAEVAAALHGVAERLQPHPLQAEHQLQRLRRGRIRRTLRQYNAYWRQERSD